MVGAYSAPKLKGKDKVSPSCGPGSKCFYAALYCARVKNRDDYDFDGVLVIRETKNNDLQRQLFGSCISVIQPPSYGTITMK